MVRDQLSMGNLRYYRTSVLIGILSIPITVGLNWALATRNVQALPLFAACVVTGYLYQSDGVRAGAVTALTGSIPILLRQAEMVVTDWWGNPVLVAVVNNSWLEGAVSVGAAVLTVGGTLAVLLVVGLVGGGAGEWIDSRVGDSQRFRTGA